MKTLTLTLRNQEVEVLISTHSPEPDVGLFGRSVDGWKLLGDPGKWALTDEEANFVDLAVDKYMEENGSDDIWDEDEDGFEVEHNPEEDLE